MGSEFKIFLYIIIGIVYLFSRMYRKELKKQEEKRAGKKPVTRRSAEDIFRELQKTLGLPETEMTPAIPEKQNKPVKEKLKPYKSAQTKTPFNLEAQLKIKQRKPLTPGIQKKNLMPEITGETTSSNETEYRPDIDFDLRKAIIYSEILKRPVY